MYCIGMTKFTYENQSGKKDTSVWEPHREDFTPFIEDEFLSQFPKNTEILKSYVLLTHSDCIPFLYGYVVPVKMSF